MGDLAGKVHVFNAGSGARLWSYPTGGQIYSSPAVSNGTIFIGSTDGFLYAFAPGGAGGGAPSTTVTAPANGSTVPNPDGNLPLRGTATDNTRVNQVLYSVRNDNARTWWDATSRTWKKVFAQNTAVLGAGTAEPELVRLVPGAVRRRQLHRARRGASTPVASTTRPRRAAPCSSTASASRRTPPSPLPADGEVITFPGGTRQQFPVTVRGTATDPGGTTRGIKEVRVTIQNLEHGEYFCGPPGCNPFGPSRWITDNVSPKASLASPGRQLDDVEHLGADVRPSAQLHGHGVGDRRERPGRAVPPDPHVLRA